MEISNDNNIPSVVFTFDLNAYSKYSEDEKMNCLLVLQDFVDTEMLKLFPNPNSKA